MFPPFTEGACFQAFLDLLTESIGIVINTIEANMRTEDLLKQSQSLAQELQSRQQELQQTNQELQEYICQENNRYIRNLTDDFGRPVFYDAPPDHK